MSTRRQVIDYKVQDKIYENKNKQLSNYNVSYITDNHITAADTTLGDIVLEFLITTKSKPYANVIISFPGSAPVSVYSPDYYLDLSLQDQKINRNITINKTLFVSSRDMLYSLTKLETYLDSIEKRQGLSYEQLDIKIEVSRLIKELEVEEEVEEEIIVTETTTEDFGDEEIEYYEEDEEEIIEQPITVKASRRSPVVTSRTISRKVPSPTLRRVATSRSQTKVSNSSASMNRTPVLDPIVTRTYTRR